MSDYDEEIILLLFHYIKSQNKNKYVHSRYKKLFYKSLTAHQKRLRERRIPQPALQAPSDSAWSKLYSSNNDQALITLTGLDFEVFNSLAAQFEPLFHAYTPWVNDDTGMLKLKVNPNKGRKRIISATQCLGLVLAWTRTRGSAMVLQMIFGMVYTAVHIYIRFGRRLLIQILKNDADAAIKMPSNHDVKNYQDAIKEKHPSLDRVWCTMDGLKLYLQQSSDFRIQNNFYNGWTHDHYVSAVLVFCPDGTIPIACFNVLGSIHDSAIAEFGTIYGKLEKVFNTPLKGKCTVDSAFAKRRFPFLIKSSQSDPTTDDPNDLIINHEATSMRQSAEWGMRALQSSFPRLKDRFVYEEYGERRLMMKMILLLYNLRARKVGINQIKNTYMPALNVNPNDRYVGGMM